ncbi:hypothetical protein FI667_g3647, partial [Globisporangium splendens]
MHPLISSLSSADTTALTPSRRKMEQTSSSVQTQHNVAVSDPVPHHAASRAPPDREAPMLQVLGNPSLLTQITRFTTNWAATFARFEEEAVIALRQSYFHYEYPGLREPGAPDWTLPQIAVIENKLTALRVLLYVSTREPFRHDPRFQFIDVVYYAIVHDRREILRWLQCNVLVTHCANYLHESKRLVERALAMGDLDILDWLHTAFPGECSLVDPTRCDQQVALGKIDHARWLHDHGYEFTKAAMDRAAERGDLETVDFLHEHRNEGCTSAAFSSAARNGHLDLVKYLHVNYSSMCTTEAMDSAAAGGYLEIVRFLHDHRNEGCTTDAMGQAAANGHMHVVRFLHGYRKEGCTSKAMGDAAAHGHLNVVVFLHENRHEGCTTTAMDRAASRGHLEVVMFLHKNRSEGYTTRAMDGAAVSGHLEIVQFFAR